MLRRKGNRHLWFTRGVVFAIRFSPKYPYIPCSHSTLKRVIRSEFVVLLPWVKTGFEFGNSAIDIKRSFHLQGPRPAHVFHWLSTNCVKPIFSCYKNNTATRK